MSRSSRKMDHVRYALSIGQSGRNGLDDIRFVHNPLPETSLEQISLNTSIGDLVMSSPILINAMTGGAGETEQINYGLAAAAKETGVAMAVGSQMAALKNPEAAASFAVARKANPHGVLFANLGSEATADEAKRAVDMIEANAIQIHLNAVQELIMPEGDKSFTGMLKRIESIAAGAGVPVIVKEVGFGMTSDAAWRLLSAGAAAVDCGGFGGTNFAAIENARRDVPLSCFDDWGNTTAVSLLEVLVVSPPERTIASGGIRTGLEAAKALAAGAGAVGMAGFFLRVLRENGVQALIQTINDLLNEIRLIMAAAGASRLSELRRAPLVISGETAHWCFARGIDIQKYARRNGIHPFE
ncbi:type 2 isopentenyl-diphosphate Delta-isomerase [Paenibacillus alkalitolerans]|uniref:type 2 isopentenyl-diphosphate Delta-isomerase n=1 Tax=Paenibacillus alkalitolerans TaxID=2799335 RepID=UPI0018F69E2E|nr:type 2 isopentenyl-diphosphate Delta-isomerase [Paenibacillus alkalitolerans]